MSDCVEREFSMDQGVEMVPLGLYMIKGDNVWVLISSISLLPALPLLPVICLVWWSGASPIFPFDLASNTSLFSILGLTYAGNDLKCEHIGRPLTPLRALIGEIDEEKDTAIDYSELKADPLGEIRYAWWE
jgi:hypothetical protein